MLVLHLGATIRWWLGYALVALLVQLWIRFALRRDPMPFLNASKWVEAGLLLAAVGAGGVVLIQVMS